MKKILLVGFHKYDANMYPHLKCFIDKMSKHCDLEYFHFRERGYFMDRIISDPAQIFPYLRAVLGLILSVCDAIKLKFKNRKNDRIIVIDHYAYAIVCSILPNEKIILWSCDIISNDHPIYSSFFVKLFMKKCANELNYRRNVIIQSQERLDLLLESLAIADTTEQISHYFMPVFLDKTFIRQRLLSSVSRPRLLQSGGIGSYRHSDDLLNHYQYNGEKYRLYFHGRIFCEIKDLLKSCHRQPMVSSSFINPDNLCQIVDFCDIGFVGYRQSDLNFRFIAKASGQIVDFLRVGVPVIVLGENDLGVFVEENGLGIHLKTINGLNDAIGNISGNYQEFSRNCFNCFDDIFDSDRYIPDILNWIYTV